MNDEELINELLEERRLLEAENANLRSELKTARAVTEQKRAEFDVEIAELKKQLRSEDHAQDQLISERDRCESLLDELVASLGGADVHGEHSNMNDPWRSALNLAEKQYAENAELKRRVAELDAKLAATQGGSAALELFELARANAVADCQRALRDLADRLRELDGSASQETAFANKVAEELPTAVKVLAKESSNP